LPLALETMMPTLKQEIESLAPWFHNMDLDGIRTAPEHFLGDYPTVKWTRFAHAIPKDLSGKTVLDIGCNGGFYSIEMKRRRAARVVAIDSDRRYLDQARLASRVAGAEIEFHQMSVYDVAQLGETFDLVLFMGVLYHLRHPLLALDLIRHCVARDTLVFQSMQRGSEDGYQAEENYAFSDTAIFDDPAYPKLNFVEHRYADDPTNWWVPNRSCAEAMLRAAGFEIAAHPEAEVYVCRVCAPPADSAPVFAPKGRAR
jgi:tRNA (mo5U34)-methyltransferase